MRALTSLAPLATSVLAALALSLAGCSSDDSGCTTDNDCKGERICESGACVTPGGGGGGGGADAGQPPADTGVAPADTGVASDSGANPIDSGADTDAGTPVDSGVGPTDTGVGPTDTGVGPTDTGVGPADTGVGPADTGVGPSDSGTGASDAGAVVIPDGGTPCQTYCGQVMTNCNGGNAMYTDLAQCLAACDDINFVQPRTAMPGDQSGNSIYCRTYWAVQAATAVDVAATCANASPVGGGTCGSTCENYCDFVLNLCVPPPPMWFQRADCLADCGNLQANGAFNALTGDSVQCRINHAFRRDEMNFETTCPNAMPQQTPPDGACL